ncbi:MAG: ATP-dependent helicase [Deltaproteobacteria bacterium]|nr:ATP-dependent helicase [Deltaproteobacteria bacterium]
MGQERKYVLKTARPAPARLDYAAELNPEQLEVVDAPAGPVLVIAGAGSGKTRTLTYRVARLIEKGTPPEQILLLTFTNKAAKEMLSRVASLTQAIVDPRRMLGGTFHHVAFALLREHAHHLGFNGPLSLLDRADAKELMATCVAELGMGQLARRFPKADLLVELISAAINRQKPLLDLLAKERPQFLPLEEEILRAAQRFVSRKAEQGMVDFDDLLLLWKRLLTDHPHVRQLLQRRFKAILVDEYQDTNRLQGDLIDLMAAEHKNLTVVGDDAQSIYSFRGADFTNIIDFPARYPDARLCKLTRNYRSTPEILALSNASIACNRRQFKKELTSTRPSGMAPALVALRDVFQQAEFVAQRILELRDEGVPLSEMAVLYRAHSHALEIQLELTKRGIPFTVRSGVRFIESAHIKDVLAHLRFVHNPHDELAFKRMVKLVHGVGGTSAERLWEEAVRQPDPLVAMTGEALRAHVAKKALPAFDALRTMLQQLTAGRTSPPGELVRAVLEGGYRQHLELTYLEDAESRAADISQLSEYASQYPDLEGFLAEIALLNEFAAEEAVVADETPDEKVVLSSVHQAKGLEWRAVFVIWLADGRFPMSQALRELEEEEEERRLFYVACTRARDELWLTYPIVAAPRDRERLLLRVSRFIEELPAGDAAPYDRVQIEAVAHEPLPPGQVALLGARK